MTLHSTNALQAHMKGVCHLHVAETALLIPELQHFPGIGFPFLELWLLGCVAGSDKWDGVLFKSQHFSVSLAKLQNNIVVKPNVISTHL